MSKLKSAIFLVLLLQFISASVISKQKEKSGETNYKIVCYYTNWSQYRNEPAKFFPQNIDPNLCTHIIFAFAKIDSNLEIASFEWNDESDAFSKGMYHKTVALKSINKNLKVLLAVGGWNQGPVQFSDMAKTKKTRLNFVEKAVHFLKKHRFDGLDLDWEYPANRETEDRPEDKFFFTELCKDLHSAFQSHGLILSASVAAGEKYMKSAYEMSEIHTYLDFIGIMAYDMHGSWDNTTGHNAPLYANNYDLTPKLTVDYAVQSWMDHVPPEKLVLGIPTYGRSFKLHTGFESCPLTNTPTVGASAAGEYSREQGFLTYFEVCKKILESKWNYVWNDKQKVPYAYTNELLINDGEAMEWVGFDDVKSVEFKIKYAMANKLAGAMLWALDMDDFNGEFCNQGKYPLLTTINHFMNPSLKLEKPSYIMGKNKSEPADAHFKPKLESDFIVPASTEIDTLSSKLLTKTNMFSLLNNEPLHVYKFCQCKNGTHTLKSTFREDFVLSIDCSFKKVSHSTNGDPKPDEEESDGELIIRFDTNNYQPINEAKPKNTGFFLTRLFSLSSSGKQLEAALYIQAIPVLSLIYSYLV